MAACSRRRSPTRSATRSGCRPSRSARSPRPITPTRSSPPAAPIFAPWRVRIWPIRPSSLHEAAKIGYAEQVWPKQYYSATRAIHKQPGAGRCPDGQMSMATRHALVTGAGSGIGRAIALALAEAGLCVSLCGRRAEPLESVRGEITAAGGEAFVVDGFDVTDAARAWPTRSPRQFARPAKSPYWSTAPARRLRSPFDKTDLALWSRVIGINLTGTFLVTQAALPSVKRAGNGRDHQHRQHRRPDRLRLRLGLLRLQARRDRLDPRAGAGNRPHRRHRQRRLSGLYRHAAACAARSTRSRARPAAAADEARASLARANPQGRLVTPQEVADTVLWLASEKATAITGQAIAVAGGEVMGG